MTSHTLVSDIIHRYFAAYESRDRQGLEDLLSDDFTFSSPHDPHLGKAMYFERCWPNSETLGTFEIEKLFESGNEAFVRYACQPVTGNRFRNTEFFLIEGSKIKAVEVYYGSLPEEAMQT